MEIGISQKLNNIVEKAYLIFSKYTITGQSALEVCKCDCCIGDKTELELLTTPLRELSLELAYELENSADGGGNLNETKYFLPRLLELISQGEATSMNGFETSLKRLGEWNWKEWPSEESNIIFQFLSTCIQASLVAQHPCWGNEWERHFEDILIMSHKAGLDSTQLIKEIADRGDKAELGCICEILCDSRWTLFGNAFWETEAKEATKKELFSDTTLKKLLELSENSKHQQYDKYIENALDVFW